MIIRVSILFHAWKSFFYVRIKHALGVCTERGGGRRITRTIFSEKQKGPSYTYVSNFPQKIKRGRNILPNLLDVRFRTVKTDKRNIVAEALGYSNAKVPILGICSKLLRRNSSRQNSLVFRPYINSKSLSGKLCQ